MEERINDLSNPDDPASREKIAEIVLRDTGMGETLKANEATKVRVEYGSIIDDGSRDALIIVSFGPCSNLMAVYTFREDGYEYVGEVGYFNGVDNVKIVTPNDSNEKLIIFRERNNQSIGAYESSGFLKGCMYENGEFKKVLSIDENIESWWNEDSQENCDWCRVVQVSKIISNDDYKTINVEKDQAYSVADKTNSKIKPNDGDFVKKAERVVSETYYWDINWRIYLLNKMIEKSTGKEVAVLQDYGNSTYVLSGGDFDKYKIMRDDGSVDIVNYADLEKEPDSTIPDTTK